MNNIKSELINKISEANNYSHQFHKEAKHYGINLSHNKFGIATVISSLFFFPNAMPIGQYINTLNINYPITTGMFLITLSCAAIGIIGQNIVTLIYRKFHNIPKHTNEEYLEKTMHYEIETKKTENEILILETILESIKYREKIAEEFPNSFKYNPNPENLTFEDLQQKQTNLINLYNTKLNELNVLTKQLYLRNNFENYRTKPARFANYFSNGIPIYFIFSLFLGLPFSVESHSLKFETISEFFKIFSYSLIPGIISIPFTSIFTKKKNQEYLNVFNTLNQQLESQALDIKPNKKIEKELDLLFTEKFKEIIDIVKYLTETTEAIIEINPDYPINQLFEKQTIMKKNLLTEQEKNSFTHNLSSYEKDNEKYDIYGTQYIAPSEDLKKRIRKIK